MNYYMKSFLTVKSWIFQSQLGNRSDFMSERKVRTFSVKIESRVMDNVHRLPREGYDRESPAVGGIPLLCEKGRWCHRDNTNQFWLSLAQHLFCKQIFLTVYFS